MLCSRNDRPLTKDIISKAHLRSFLKVRRQQISLAERQKAAADAALLLLHTDIFRQSQQIACYYPFNNEFDCFPIIQEVWRANKNCYLPVLSLAKLNHLDFILYQPDTVLKPNRYNIPEPISPISIKAEKLDLVLLPLLGFDEKGNRLGMGAGYYDRTFQIKQKPLLFGLAYEEQYVSHIPCDTWDVPLNGVVTEKRIRLY